MEGELNLRLITNFPGLLKTLHDGEWQFSLRIVNVQHMFQTFDKVELMSVVPCTVRQVTGLSHSALKNVNQYRSKFVTHKNWTPPFSEQLCRKNLASFYASFVLYVCVPKINISSSDKSNKKLALRATTCDEGLLVSTISCKRKCG